MSKEVYGAAMAYKTPQQYKRNAEDSLELYMGKQTLTITSALYEVMITNKLKARINYQGTRIDIDLYKNKFNIMFNVEF
jgi:hypothetical protein